MARRRLPCTGAAFLIFVGLASQPARGTTEPDIEKLTIVKVREGLLSGAYKAVDLVKAHLDRARRYDKAYRSFVSFSADAMARAAALDEQYRRSGPVGPLHGVPVIIKDNINRAGEITSAGYRGFHADKGGLDLRAQTGATVVERLEDAGAIIIGRANMPDFAGGGGDLTTSTVRGPTRNVYLPDRIPGGSSGGTAVAVGAAFVVAGIGTETGGSIQNPAAANGVVGVTPTHGLVPIAGILPREESYDVAGPIARSVRDAAIMLDVLADRPRKLMCPGNGTAPTYEAGLSDRALEGRRFAGLRPNDLVEAEAETIVAYETAIAALERQGAVFVRDANFYADPVVKAMLAQPDITPEPFFFSFQAEFNDYLKDTKADNGMTSFQQFLNISGLDRHELRWTLPEEATRAENVDRQAADKARRAIRLRQDSRHDVLTAFLQRYQLDGLFLPQSLRPTPLFETLLPTWTQRLGGYFVPSVFGSATVTLSAGIYRQGTPFAVLFAGLRNSECALLSYAYDLELAMDARLTPILDDRPARRPGRSKP